MATILAHLQVRAGAEAAFEDLARSLFRDTHDREDGVLRYEYWRGAEPRTYYALLSFRDAHTFISHQMSEHHEAAGAALDRVLESLRLEWVDPIVGACDLPPTVEQGPPADADDETRAVSRRFAAQVASWWVPLR